MASFDFSFRGIASGRSDTTLMPDLWQVVVRRRSLTPPPLRCSVKPAGSAPGRAGRCFAEDPPNHWENRLMSAHFVDCFDLTIGWPLDDDHEKSRACKPDGTSYVLIS